MMMVDGSGTASVSTWTDKQTKTQPQTGQQASKSRTEPAIPVTKKCQPVCW